MIHLGQQFRHGRKIEVPLQQGREHAEGLVSLVQQRPDARDDIGAVGIDDQVLSLVEMAGDMAVDDPFAGQ